MKFKLTVILLSVLGMLACSKEGELAEELAVENIEALTQVDPSGATLTFTVYSTRAWVISTENLTWADISPVRGEAEQTVTVSVNVTENKVFERSAQIVVVAGSLRKSIDLKQAAKTGTQLFTIEGLDNESIVFDSQEMTDKVFNVTSFEDWSVESENLDWAYIQADGGPAGQTMEIAIAPRSLNLTETPRQGTIKLRSASGSKSISILQNAASNKPFLTVNGFTNATINMGPSALSTIDLSIASKADWSASTDATWITLLNKGGKGTDGPLFTVTIAGTPNSAAARQGVITFTSGELTATATIAQRAADGVEQVFFEDDFSWATSTNSTMFCVASNDAGTGESLASSWYKFTSGASADKGYMLRPSYRGGCIKLGSASAVGRIVYPVIDILEDEPATVLISLHALACPGNNTTLTVAIQGRDGADDANFTLNEYKIYSDKSWIEDPFQGWYKIVCRVPLLCYNQRVTVKPITTSNSSWYVDDVRMTNDDPSVVEGCFKEPVSVAAPAQPSITVDHNQTSFDVVINNNVDFTVSADADWIKSHKTIVDNTKFDNGSQSTVTFECEANTSVEKRMGTVTIKNAVTAETFSVSVNQLSSSMSQFVTFPVTFTTNPTGKLSYGNFDGQTKRGLRNMADDELAYMECVIASDNTRTPEPSKLTTPYYFAKNMGTGDYVEFVLPVENMAAGTKINFSAGLSGGNAYGQRYYSIDYFDAGEWKPTSEPHTEEIIITGGANAGTYQVEGVNYTVSSTATAPSTMVDETFTVTQAITKGELRLRVRTTDERFGATRRTDFVTSFVYMGARLSNPTFSIVE